MDEHTSYEQAFQNGYEKGKQDALKWISASEPPKKNGKYLCRYVFSENYDYPFYQVLYYFATYEKPHFQHEGELGLKVTHWKPITEPPKGEHNNGC